MIFTVLWLLYDCLALKNKVNVLSKKNKQKNFLLAPWKSLTKQAGSGSVNQCCGSRSVPKCHGSATLAFTPAHGSVLDRDPQPDLPQSESHGDPDRNSNTTLPVLVSLQWQSFLIAQFSHFTQQFWHRYLWLNAGMSILKLPLAEPYMLFASFFPSKPQSKELTRGPPWVS